MPGQFFVLQGTGGFCIFALMLTIYKASAGSGKTYRLAYEYIRLLLARHPDGPDGPCRLNPHPTASHRHILAITFTNKATAEMKDRIVRELSALTRVPGAPGDKDAPYAADLMDAFGCTRSELAAAASEALMSLLHDYSSFNVSTIDSFFQTVLRAFAREIDRQGDYRVELEPRYVIAAAVAMLFDDLRFAPSDKSGPIMDWLADRAGARAGDGKDFNPFYRGSGMYTEILRWLAHTFNEDFSQHAADLHTYMADPSRLTAFTGALTDAVAENNRLQYEATARVLAIPSYADLNRFLKTLLGTVTPADGLPAAKTESILFPTAAYMMALSTGTPDKCYRAKAAFTEYPELFRWYGTMRRLLTRRSMLMRLPESLHGLRAITYIDSYISRFRIENNLILLADTNTLLSSIISDDETPFIYERIGQPLRHFLIDEFQDTSALQWHNLRPLVANSLCENHESLIIGDVKQSIYRWRGGDSSLLDTSVARTDFPRHSRELGTAPGENTNYRSAHDIVRFNNTVFSRLAAAAGVRGYAGIEQSLPAGTASLPAHITFSIIAQRPGQNGPDPAETALHRMAALMLDQHGRGYRWNEIAALFRTRRGMARAVQFLLENYPSIPVMSDEALLVRNAVSVKLIISILELIDKSAEGRPAADAERHTDTGPDPAWRSRSDAEILVDRFEYFVAHGREPQQALADAMDLTIDVARGCRSSLSDDIAAIRALAPANLTAMVEAIIERKVSPQLRAAEFSYLTAFVDTVADFSRAYNPTVHTFLEYWARNSGRIAVASGQGQNAVTMMTVHAAKGLEWPCVHIPLMNWALEPDLNEMWVTLDGLDEIDPALRPPIVFYRPVKPDALPDSPVHTRVTAARDADMAENLNIAYVAFTRAVRELHISSPGTQRGISDMAEAVLSAIAQPMSAAETAAALYTDTTAALNSTADTLEIGAPTLPERKAETPAAATVARPPYTVRFSTLTDSITTVDDLTTTDSALDPYIGGSVAPLPITDTVRPDSSEAMRRAARRGMALHAILARMRSLDDLDSAITAEASRLTPDDTELYRQTIISAFRAHPDLTARWFDPGAPRVLTEQPIFLPDREENYRPDRIIWCADGCVDVVDYKFTSAQLDSHRSQVLGYVRMLASMGIGRIRGYVWYPAMRQVTEVEQ